VQVHMPPKAIKEFEVVYHGKAAAPSSAAASDLKSAMNSVISKNKKGTPSGLAITTDDVLITPKKGGDELYKCKPSDIKLALENPSSKKVFCFVAKAEIHVFKASSGGGGGARE